MSQVKTVATQATTNGTIEVLIPTLLTVDGKAGWMINGVRFLAPGLNVAVSPLVDCNLFMQLNTETGDQLPTDPDSIVYEVAGFSGIAASTSAFQVQSSFESVIPNGRLTVQPDLFFRLTSSGMTAALTVYVTVFYDIVKLTDLEVMRLMQGGA